MSKSLRVLAVLLVLFILGNIIFLLTPLEKIKNISFFNKVSIRLSEKKIGKDFIALSDEKILELLSLPENKGKFICPFNVDEMTRIRIDREGEGEVIEIVSFRDDRPETRVLYKPSSSEILFSTKPWKAGQRVYFRYDNITFVVVDPENILAINPIDIKKVNFGGVLARGFKVEPDSELIKKYGKFSARIYSQEDGLTRKISSFMLKYKERWVTFARK